MWPSDTSVKMRLAKEKVKMRKASLEVPGVEEGTTERIKGG